MALLTVGYIFVTSRQLDVMEDQLELQNQPLPWIHRIKLIVEKPCFYRSPSEAPNERYEYDFLSRYRVEFALKNMGNCPAISVDASGRIQVLQGNGPNKLDSMSRRIDILGLEDIHSPEPSSNIPFLFADDRNGVLLGALMETIPERAPRLLTRIIYKNVLGACFVIYNDFLIYPKDIAQDSIIKGWLTAIRSFPIQYKDEIESLHKFNGMRSEKSSELFERIKLEIDSSIKEDDLELRLLPIPGALKVRIISKDQYNELEESLRYGRPLSPKAIYSPPCKEE